MPIGSNRVSGYFLVNIHTYYKTKILFYQSYNMSFYLYDISNFNIIIKVDHNL